MQATTLGLTAAALQRFLDTIEPGRQPVVTTVTPVAGGYSRDTAIAEVQWSGGTSERFVLRGDPPPSVFISDRGGEWQLLQALAKTTGPVSIPSPRWFDADGTSFGAKCIISEFYEGRTLQDLAREHEDDLSQVRDEFVDTIVDIHRTPIEDLPADLPRAQEWDLYIAGLIDLIDQFSRPAATPVPGCATRRRGCDRTGRRPYR